MNKEVAEDKNGDAGQTKQPPIVQQQKSEEEEGVRQQNSKGKKGDSGVGKGWRWLTLLLLLVLVLLAGLATWFGYQYWQDLVAGKTANAVQAVRLDSLNKQFSAHKQTVAEKQRELSEQLAELNSRLAEQGQTLSQFVSQDREQWLIAELDYLVRLANQRLLTERRPAGALTLLSAAYQLLANSDNAKALPVREVLARDISALRLVTVVDREGIYARLGALSPALQNLSTLPPESIVSSPANEQVPQAPLNDSAEAPTGAVPRVWYETLLGNAQAAIARFSSKYFHVRYRDVPPDPLVSTAQEQHLRQAMIVHLANAQQALLNEEQGIYNASLAAVDSYIRDYFVDAQSAGALRAEVAELANLSVRLTLPDISGSIEALKLLSVKTVSDDTDLRSDRS